MSQQNSVTRFTFSERLTLLMEEEGLRPAQLARSCGVDRAYISMLKNGKRENPNSVLLEKIAAALGVTANWLLTGDEPRGRPVIDSFAGSSVREEPAVYGRPPDYKAEFMRLAETENIDWLLDRMEHLSAAADFGDAVAQSTLHKLIPVVRKRVQELKAESKAP